jgi:hypothetical protein
VPPGRHDGGQGSRRGITVDACIAIWNGPGNAAVRDATRPPNGPTGTFFTPVGEPDTLAGGDTYRVFVGLALDRRTIADREPPPRACYVHFYYPGSQDRPVSMLTIRTSGDCRAYKLETASLYNTETNTSVTDLPEALHADDGTLSLRTAPPGSPDRPA